MSHEAIHHCLNCGQSETAVPLVALRYRGQPNWICSQCLPDLIHRPQLLVGRLADAGQLKPAPSAADH